MKRAFFFVILCLVLVISSSRCYAQTPTSLELINNAKQYDGRIITYKGEVIGDVMVRQDFAWLHLNDGIIAIGIWVPKAMIQDIRYAGEYHKKGDIIEASGMFHRSCLEHGGDLDIHASEIKKVTSGSLVIQPISRKKVYIAVYSLILVSLFYILKRFSQSR